MCCVPKGANIIDALPVKVKFKDIKIMERFPNISYDDYADITVVTDGDDWKVSWGDKILEYWTTSKNSVQKDPPVIYLSSNSEMLPYCMRDRLVYLQDKINKELGRY